MPRNISPIRYPGGKTRALPVIMPYIRKGADLLSPFFGGGSVEFSAARLGSRVYGFDTYSPLACFYQELKNNRGGLRDALLALLPLTNEKFLEFHAGVHEMPDGPEKAAGFFALIYSTHYGLGQSDSPTRSQERFDLPMIEKKLSISMDNITVECVDFRESFARHKEIQAFIDPPYIMESKSAESIYGTKGSHHRNFDHDALFDTLKDRGNWIMTHHDHPEIRERYKDFSMDDHTWHHSMSSKPGKELIIKSRDHAQPDVKSYLGHGIGTAKTTKVISLNPLQKWLQCKKTNPVTLSMTKAALDIESVVSGRSNIAIISGVPGVGKSHLLHNCAARMEKRGIGTAFVQFSHPRDLDDAIFEAQGRQLIVADEADGVLRSAAQISRLKLLADPTYKSPLKIGAGHNARTLQLTCPIILAFNANTQVTDRAIQTQLNALYSRKQPVVIAGNRRELWEYSVMVALTTDLLKNYRLRGLLVGGSLANFSKAIDLFSKNMWNLKELSPRCLQKIYQLVCEQSADVLSLNDFEVEIFSLMENGPRQQQNLPQLEDWGALRKAYIVSQYRNTPPPTNRVA